MPFSTSMDALLHFDIQPQPDDITCGPTSLHAVYGYYGDRITLDDVIAEAGRLDEGGTLAVMLGRHALKRGYRATIYTYNLLLFDPTWFADGIDIPARLRAQQRVKPSPKLQEATAAYLDYLALGGQVRFEELTGSLIRGYLKRHIPILVGLSATYLYGCAREIFHDGRTAVYDDVRGEPTGHFVVLCGYDRENRRVLVADPLATNPLSPDRLYHVDVNRLICSIMLGCLTYDANLLILEPQEWGQGSGVRGQGG